MITAVVLTHNSEATIRRTLASLTMLDEVLLIDSHSTDQTLDIAKEFPNVRSLSYSFQNFGNSRNYGANQANNDWILMVDSDEVLSPGLQKELNLLRLTKNAVYSFPFRNYYRGKWIRGCGWWPDRHIRLYNRQQTSYQELRVHESLDLQDLQEVRLQTPIEHYSYNNSADFTRKMHAYAVLFAEEYQGKKKPGKFTPCLRGIWTFLRSYFLRKGFLAGCDGFLISFYQGATAYFKYRLLWEKQNPVSSPHPLVKQ